MKTVMSNQDVTAISVIPRHVRDVTRFVLPNYLRADQDPAPQWPLNRWLFLHNEPLVVFELSLREQHSFDAEAHVDISVAIMHKSTTQNCVRTTRDYKNTLGNKTLLLASIMNPEKNRGTVTVCRIVPCAMPTRPAIFIIIRHVKTEHVGLTVRGVQCECEVQMVPSSSTHVFAPQHSRADEARHEREGNNGKSVYVPSP